MKKQNVFAHLFSYMGRFKITMTLSIILAAVAAVLNLSAFVCVYNIGKEIVQSLGDFTRLNQTYMKELGWQAVFLISASFGTYGFSLLFSHITAFNTVAKIRIHLVEHIGLVQSAVLPIAFLVFMFRYDWRLSFICLLPILLGFMVLAAMLKGTSEGLAKQYQKSAEDISNAATEYVRGISVVKVFGQTASSFRRYKTAVKEYSDYVIKYAFSMENSDSIYNTVINGIFFFLIPGGIILFNASRNPERMILSFIFFAVLIPAVVTILNRIMKSSSNMMVASSSLDAIEKILAEQSLPQAAVTKQPDSYNITLDHVSFAYEDGAEKALTDVSLTIGQGTVTALVGESGGGKSTIANLIARFWDVQSGSVKVGGVDVRNMDYNAWMEQVSIVFQDTNLFKMSIADNVAFYTPGASRNDILRALHLAQCDDILEKLPDGADTVIGTKGVYLSGGEMQRISLARAILKDAPVVLLDEATAFADSENEHLIQKALDELLRGKTVLMIAHRLSTVIHADQICVLERGAITEKGTHDELLKKDGMYAHMFREYQNSISWRIGGRKNA